MRLYLKILATVMKVKLCEIGMKMMHLMHQRTMELQRYMDSDADLKDTWKTRKMSHIVTHTIHPMLEPAPLESPFTTGFLCALNRI